MEENLEFPALPENYSKYVNRRGDMITFICGHEEIPVDSLDAEMMAPAFAERRRADPTVMSFTVSTNVPIDFLRRIYSYIVENQTITFKKSEVCSFIDLCSELKNQILLNRFVDVLFGDDMQLDNHEDLLDRLDLSCNTPRYSSVVKYISQNFRRFSDVFFIDLPIHHFEAVLREPSLRIESESYLLKLLMTVADDNPSVSSLFGFVKFGYVQRDVLETFLGWCGRHSDLELPSVCFYSALQGMLSCNARIWPNRYDGVISRYEKLEFPAPIELHGAKNCDIFDGVIRFLEYKKKPVAFTYSSLIDHVCHPPERYRHVGVTMSYHSETNDREPWICYNFESCRISLSAIAIRNRSINNQYHDGLKEFNIWVSNDGVDWGSEPLAHIEVNELLNGNGLFAVFPIKKRQQAYQYIKVQKTAEPNYSGREYLIIRSLELFGDLYGYTE